jgi:pilus assembly protein CpaC
VQQQEIKGDSHRSNPGGAFPRPVRLMNTDTNMITIKSFASGSEAACRSTSKSVRKNDAALFKPVCASLLCLLAGLFLSAAHAQTSNPVAGSISSPALNDGSVADAKPANEMLLQPRNAFAENLRPKVKRSAVIQNQPYNPIKKQDDQSQVPEIEMFVGESRVFPAPGVARIAVGNGQIMTAAALDGKEVLIFANGVGTSSLFVWNEDGRYQRVKINIVPGDTTRIAREVAAFLTGIPKTKASIVGDKVIVEGDGLSDADLAKIKLLGTRYPQIINFTDNVGWEQMVMMDVKVVEFPKTELREIGLKWNATGGAAMGAIWSPASRGRAGPYAINIQTGQNNTPPITDPSGSGGVVIPSSLNALSYLNLGLNAQLNLLEQEGRASILAEPQLSARNGAKASFLAGGEFPYSVATNNGVTIIFKEYGIKLEIEPKVDRTGTIRATIKAEISSLDPSVTTISGPALLTRKTDTEFNVASGDTIVLAGLLQRDNSTNIDKVPLLGDIPILGALFRSKRFQNKETELVVFVTPTVVDSRSPGLVDRVERATERLRDHLGREPYLSDPLQPGHDPAKANVNPSRPQAEIEQRMPVTADADSVAMMPVSTPVSSHDRPQAIQPMIKGGSTLRVKTEGLNLREKPTVDSPLLMRLGYGAIVQLGAADPQPPGTGRWRNVVVGAIEGWVLASGVEPSHLLSDIKTNARSEAASPDQGGAELALGPNAKGGGVAAASLQQVTPVTVSTDGTGPQHYRVALERMALRVTPDVNAPIVQNLSEGQLVVALPQAPRGYWIAIQAGDVRGWAASQWLHPISTQN